jgi:hypothetical protein
MSVAVSIPPYRAIAGHVSSGGWEIDKYSDGTWEGIYKASSSAAMTTNVGNGMYTTSSGINVNDPPAGYALDTDKAYGAMCYGGTSRYGVMMSLSGRFVWSPLAYTSHTAPVIFQMRGGGTWS